MEDDHPHKAALAKKSRWYDNECKQYGRRIGGTANPLTAVLRWPNVDCCRGLVQNSTFDPNKFSELQTLRAESKLIKYQKK